MFSLFLLKNQNINFTVSLLAVFDSQVGSGVPFPCIKKTFLIQGNFGSYWYCSAFTFFPST